MYSLLEGNQISYFTSALAFSKQCIALQGAYRWVFSIESTLVYCKRNLLETKTLKSFLHLKLSNLT